MLRRGLLLLPLALPACSTTPAEPEPLPRLVTGYGHLTPIRLNVASVEVVPPGPDAIRISQPVPVSPEGEILQMARERVIAAGTEGSGRFLTRLVEFRREGQGRQGGLGGMFSGDPGERLSIRLQVRLEVSAPDGRSGFVEAEARRQRTVPDGSTPAQRRRAAEELVHQAMDDLNVEFEFQVRRTLRSWLVEAVTPPGGEGGVQVEELPRS